MENRWMSKLVQQMIADFVKRGRNGSREFLYRSRFSRKTGRGIPIRWRIRGIHSSTFADFYRRDLCIVRNAQRMPRLLWSFQRSGSERLPEAIRYWRMTQLVQHARTQSPEERYQFWADWTLPNKNRSNDPFRVWAARQVHCPYLFDGE